MSSFVRRGRDSVDKFEAAARDDPRRGDRRVQGCEGWRRRSPRRPSRRPTEAGILDVAGIRSRERSSGRQMNRDKEGIHTIVIAGRRYLRNERQRRSRDSPANNKHLYGA